LASSHHNKLKTWAQKHNVKSTVLDLANYPQLLAVIPSTPAIIVTDKNNNIIYVGPYSRGAGCFSASGQIDNYLDQWFTQTDPKSVPKSTIIETDATGCYCASS
jgi:hypothetical protein